MMYFFSASAFHLDRPWMPPGVRLAGNGQVPVALGSRGVFSTAAARSLRRVRPIARRDLHSWNGKTKQSGTQAPGRFA